MKEGKCPKCDGPRAYGERLCVRCSLVGRTTVDLRELVDAGEVEPEDISDEALERVRAQARAARREMDASRQRLHFAASACHQAPPRLHWPLLVVSCLVVVLVGLALAGMLEPQMVCWD